MSKSSKKEYIGIQEGDGYFYINLGANHSSQTLVQTCITVKVFLDEMDT